MNEIIILIADDDLEDRFIIGDSFQDIGKTGLRIDYCEDGVEVMEYLQRAKELNTLPRLIILDLNMPRMTGKETVAALKKDPAYQSIPVIILSTSAMDHIKTECLDLGALDYYIKPTAYQHSIELATYFYELAAGIKAPEQ